MFFPGEIGSAKGRGELVLLVESESRPSEKISSILTDSGFQVLVAKDSRQALALFRDRIEKTALIVTDLVKPGKSGSPLARAVWAMKPNIPILFRTGCTPQNLQWRVHLTKRPAGFLLKPHTAQELVWEVYRLLHRFDQMGSAFAILWR